MKKFYILDVQNNDATWAYSVMKNWNRLDEC